MAFVLHTPTRSADCARAAGVQCRGTIPSFQGWRSPMYRMGLALAPLLLAVTAIVGSAAAEGTFPDRPIRFVVPFPPGGGADNLARAIVPKAAQVLGVPIVIDNRPGAGG